MKVEVLFVGFIMIMTNTFLYREGTYKVERFIWSLIKIVYGTFLGTRFFARYYSHMIPQEQSKTLAVVNTHTYTHTTFNIQQTSYFMYLRLQAQRGRVGQVSRHSASHLETPQSTALRNVNDTVNPNIPRQLILAIIEIDRFI